MQMLKQVGGGIPVTELCRKHGCPTRIKMKFKDIEQPFGRT